MVVNLYFIIAAFTLYSSRRNVIFINSTFSREGKIKRSKEFEIALKTSLCWPLIYALIELIHVQDKKA